MPALFTRISTAPNSFSACATMPRISAGLLISAAEYDVFTLNFLAVSATTLSISALSPNPLKRMFTFRRERFGDAEPDTAGGTCDDG